MFPGKHPYLDMSPCIKHDILRLQIPVHDAVVVQKYQNEGNLGGIKLRHGKVEFAEPAQVAKQFTARGILELIMISRQL